jgi:selenocysteine-specific elongation factor
MIVATAGHVDHGKTTLIKALTGTDTTHLPEERRRGMTIDLGFAGLPLPEGGAIGLIDVPGHEKFIRNMLAGITGVDLALLVVAADDGVMPQTREHLEILDLLQVSEGVVAITKVDRVEPSRLSEVCESMNALLAPTRLARAAIFPVSAPTGQGIPALRDHLFARAAAASRKRHGSLFRLPIDRSFVLEGAGRVVTGTIASGRVSPDDRLTLMPHDKTVRARGLHAHKTAVESLGAGERGAINVVGPGVDRSQIGRGDWIVAPEIAVMTQRLDVRLTLAAGASLKPGGQLHFCHGAGAVFGRLVRLTGEGNPIYAHVALNEPVHALTRDSFILRHATGNKTLAGGVVLNPFPSNRRTTRAEWQKTIEALDQLDARSALSRLLPVAPDGVDLERVAQAWNMTKEEAEAVWRGLPLIRFQGKGYDSTQWQLGRQTLLSEVSRFHGAHPDSLGPFAANLLRTDKLAGSRVFRSALLDSLIQDKALVRDGAQVRQPSHSIELSAAEKVLWRRISPLLGPNRRPMTVHDIARQERLDVRVVEKVVHRAARAGHIVRIAAGRYLHKAVFLELASKAQSLAAGCDTGMFAVTAFRDRSNLGRGVSIELLEYFDRIGFTQRVGDLRRILRPADTVAEPSQMRMTP